MRSQDALPETTPEAIMNDAWKKRVVVSKANAQAIGTPGWYSRGYLPHFNAERQTQTMTFRLFDSMPQEVLDAWREEISSLPKKEYDLERRKRIDAYLDQGYGSCYLRDDRIAEIVQNALLHFDGERYFLHAWVVMPNHVHVLYTPDAGWELSQIAHSWKSYTASASNKALGRKGEFWQPEPFDRYIRDEKHFKNAVSYIENNPVKAGLCGKPEDWRWSSAYLKRRS
jgi:putative DNA methylase